MIDTRLLVRLLASARTVTAIGASTAVREAAAATDGFVRAQVEQRLADGSYRVVVDGRALKLALPAEVKAGDVIELRIPMRQIANARTPAADAAGGGALSGTGRLISALLREAPAAPPRQAQPVLEMPPGAAADLPLPLARAIERSGMFYESHQARWIEGDYPLERLLQEPQAALSDAPAAAKTAPESAAAAPRADAALEAADGAPGAHESGVATRAVAERTADAGAVPGRASDEPPAPLREALPLIRSQLEALDSRQFAWLGQIWPDQSMHWEIEENGAQEPCADSVPGWTTRLSLELPALGAVAADLALAAGGARVHLRAGSERAEELMRAAAEELEHALTAAGIEPARVMVSRDDAAP